MAQLSKRLSVALRFLKGITVLADIGCDHGYLPIEAVKSKMVKQAVASDNKIGPLQKAIENIEKAGLNDQIETQCAEGLSALSNKVDGISILGMGGEQIVKILSEGKTESINVLVLGPNSEAGAVRFWLQNNGFLIDDEAFVKDHRHYYQIIRAIKGEMNLDYQEMQFGPINIIRQDSLMLEYVNYEIHKLEEAMKLSSSSIKKTEIIDKIAKLKGVFR
jgi:tRNA (adenine22-N1)-methyltransferase